MRLKLFSIIQPQRVGGFRNGDTEIESKTLIIFFLKAFWGFGVLLRQVSFSAQHRAPEQREETALPGLF